MRARARGRISTNDRRAQKIRRMRKRTQLCALGQSILWHTHTHTLSRISRASVSKAHSIGDLLEFLVRASERVRARARNKHGAPCKRAVGLLKFLLARCWVRARVLCDINLATVSESDHHFCERRMRARLDLSSLLASAGTRTRARCCSRPSYPARVRRRRRRFMQTRCGRRAGAH